MEEINYQPMETYLGNSAENSNQSIKYEKSNSNSEENLVNFKKNSSLNEENIIKTNENENDNNDNSLLKEKLFINIDTLQSLRISHSFEETKNSQSLLDIINKGNYIFEENEYNNNDINNENDMNTLKKQNNRNEIENNFNTNKCNYNSNSIYKNKNSIISDKESNMSNKNINNNNTSAKTKNSLINNIKNDFSNDYNYKNNSKYKVKIEEMFKEQFEERIKPKSYAVTKKEKILIPNLKNKNINNVNDNKLKPKTLEHQNKIDDMLSIDSNISNIFSNYDSNNELVNYNSNKNEKIIEENKIKINEDIFSPVKRKELIFSNIDNKKQYNIEVLDNIDDSNNNDKKDLETYLKNNKNDKDYKNKKSNELIIGILGEKPDSSMEDEDDKNIMVSELDIDISYSNNKNNIINKKLNNEEIKINNMNLEKAIENNIKKGNFKKYENCKISENIKEKNIINEKEKDKNLYKCNNYSYNYNNIKNKSKIIEDPNKKLKFNNKIKKKIYPRKKIDSFINIKNLRHAKHKEEEKINNNYEYFIKIYKKRYSSIKFNNNNLITNQDIKNISNNSGSYCSSLLPLNTSFHSYNITKRENLGHRNMAYTADGNINKNNHSLYCCKSNPIEKKVKKYYINPYKRKNYSLSKKKKKINSNRNNYKIFKSKSKTSDNSNKASIINIPNLITNKNIFSINVIKPKIKISNKSNNINIDSSKNSNISDNKKEYYKSLNNSIKNTNKSIKNKKKNDIPICNITRNKISNKIPFKRKIMGLKKKELYSNNAKIINKINSLNNIIYRANSYHNKNTKNLINNSNISNTSLRLSNYNTNLFDINKNNNNIYSKIHKTYLKISKQINNNINNNNSDNSSSLLNHNINNYIKNSYIQNKIKNNNKLNNNYNNNLNFLTEYNCISKYPYLNKLLKNFNNKSIKSKKAKNKGVLINDKIISKNYIRNISHNNDNNNCLNIFKINDNEPKNILNKALNTISNNTNKRMHKNRIFNSYRNIKNINVEGNLNISDSLNKNKL